MIKVAVIGSGYWGKNLVRNFHVLGSLEAICDNDAQVLAGFQNTYQNIPVVHDLDNLLDGSGPQVDAVVISTPAETHYRLAKKSLLAKKHVFVEKPLSLTEEEGQDLAELAEQNELVLMVGHILQYHTAVLKLKELIDNGELGKIQYLYSNRLSIGKIRTEENILWSFAPHDISVILMLLGEMPQTVYATGGAYLQQQVADVTLTAMDFAGGVKAHIFVSWLHPFKEQKLVVVGDKKMAVFDDVSKEKLFLYPHRIEWLNRAPVASKAEAEIVPLEMSEPLRAECQHFLACIQNGDRPKTDGLEGLRVLQILNACQESLDNGGHKIELHEPTQPSPSWKPKLSDQGLPRLSCREERPYQGEIRRPFNSGNKPIEPPYFVHDSSYIDDGVEIGANTSIWHFSHILAGSKIGKNCKIGQNVVIGPKATLGDGCKIQNNVSIYEGVTLEDDVFCGPSMVFTNVFNPRCHIPRMKELRPTLVKKGATIGANATIICGHTIGSYSFIGAGALVTKSVPNYALIQGVPGRISGWMCQCGTRLVFSDDMASCKSCGLKYLNEGNNVKKV